MSFKKWLMLRENKIEQTPFGKENHEGKLELVVLVGPPAVGKSTYVAQKFPKNSVTVISRDDIVDEVAKEIDKTYDDMFKPSPEIDKANKEVNKRLSDAFARASKLDKHIVVDMTNMTPKARRSAIERVGGKDKYFKRAVVFTLSDSDFPTLLARMEERAAMIKSQGGSKTIGRDVMMRMMSSYQQVTPEEGFDRVDTFNSFKV